MCGLSLSATATAQEVRYILSDLIPQMVRMVEPLERLSAVLGSTPRIEPHPVKLAALERPLVSHPHPHPYHHPHHHPHHQQQLSN
jgi:hypothetical protein